MAHGHKTEHRLRVCAQVMLHAARGRSNACVAREAGLHLDTVRRWRGRFAQAACPGSKTVNAAAIGFLPGDGDEYVITEGGLEGQRGYFSRDADGTVTGVDIAGRLFNRVTQAS